MKTSSLLVIGIGNEDRGDDGVGIVVAQRIKERPHSLVVVKEQRGAEHRLMEVWKGFDRVILVDAVSSGAEAGTVHRIDAHKDPIPISFFRCSTHGFGVAEAVGMARSLGKLPSYLVIYGIEGKNFDLGRGLSNEVEKAVRIVTERLLSEEMKESHA